jgi:hypothetical protein
MCAGIVGVVIDHPENFFAHASISIAPKSRVWGRQTKTEPSALLQRPPERASPSASVVVQFLRPSAEHRKSIAHRHYALSVSQFPPQVASAT